MDELDYDSEGDEEADLLDALDHLLPELSIFEDGTFVYLKPVIPAHTVLDENSFYVTLFKQFFLTILSEKIDRCYDGLLRDSDTDKGVDAL